MDKGEINNLVAEKVMGYVRSKYRGQDGWGTPDQNKWFSHFNPAGDISDSWLVVEKMRHVSDSLYGFDISDGYEEDYQCCFYGMARSYTAEADSLMMAICKAALMTKGINL